MLYYNIYSNLDDKQYLEIERRLIVIEERMIKELLSLGWKLQCSVVQNDALIVDFTIDEKLFFGNLGIEYTDNREGQLFSFYVTKSFDGQDKRYFVKEMLYQNKILTFYESNLEIIVNKALILYHSWDLKYLHLRSM